MFPCPIGHRIYHPATSAKKAPQEIGDIRSPGLDHQAQDICSGAFPLHPPKRSHCCRYESRNASEYRECTAARDLKFSLSAAQNARSSPASSESGSPNNRFPFQLLQHWKIAEKQPCVSMRSGVAVWTSIFLLWSIPAPGGHPSVALRGLQIYQCKMHTTAPDPKMLSGGFGSESPANPTWRLQRPFQEPLISFLALISALKNTHIAETERPWTV